MSVGGISSANPTDLLLLMAQAQTDLASKMVKLNVETKLQAAPTATLAAVAGVGQLIDAKV